MSTESARIHTYGCDRHKEDTYEGCYSCDLEDNSAVSSRLNARIAELERQNHDLSSALRELLQDTQHAKHNCGDGPDLCPVARARELLGELMESVTK